ncbi:MAG: biotin--[acetyl-CoA-carboxylase] ligase [Saprospiraceae bacterium]|nr:biotin--[acetyl-CoA-carboxylase] ligase [Saprospiraceae bacterium]
MYNLNIIKLEKTDSTNNYARQLIESGNISEITVIAADEQLQGKGHSENRWESEKGKNLTFSAILSPHFLEIQKQFILTKVISLAIADFISEYVDKSPVKIKWPNDIYVNDKKICGILIENVVKGDLFEYSVVGIGININQTEFKSNAPNPISLKLLNGTDYNLKELFYKILKHIENRYAQLMNPVLNTLDKEYLNSLYKFNELADYRFQNKEIKAKIIGVTKFGKLIVKTADEELIECDFKEIEYM